MARDLQQFVVRLEPDEHSRLRRQAQAEDLTMAQVARRAIKLYLDTERALRSRTSHDIRSTK